MSDRLDDLSRAVDRVLLDLMPAALRDAIDDLLVSGADPADVLARIRELAAGNDRVIVHMAEAHIEAVLKRHGASSADDLAADIASGNRCECGEPFPVECPPGTCCPRCDRLLISF